MKEEANKIINKYFNSIPHRITSRKLAVKIALISIEEQLKLLNNINSDIVDDYYDRLMNLKDEIKKG